MSPVDNRRSSRRSRRYSCARRRASVTGGVRRTPARTRVALRARRSWCGTTSAPSRARLAVPAAICELLAEQPVDESIAALAEIRAERDDPAVDAGLDLALEKGRVAEFRSPRDVVADAIDRGSRPRARRVDPQVAQEHQRVHVRPPERRGDAIAPLAVGALLVEQTRAPSLRRDARPFARHDLRRRVGEVAHDLPADGGIRVEEPVDHRI